jgi:hypothetical protein
LRRDATAFCLALAAAATLPGCGGGDDQNRFARSTCSYPKGAPLPALHLRRGVALRRTQQVVRRAARVDRTSGLPQLLGGSGYRVEDAGTWGGIGGFLDLAVERPHRVRAFVPQAGSPWPRRSPNRRFSRRYGYIPYRTFVSARRLTALQVSVDLRRRRVVDVSGSPSGGFDREETLPGHCPLPPPEED